MGLSIILEGNEEWGKRGQIRPKSRSEEDGLSMKSGYKNVERGMTRLVSEQDHVVILSVNLSNI
jgi:hypothetical protein